MTKSSLVRLSGLLVAAAVQVSSLSSQAYETKNAAAEILPVDLKLTCTIGATSSGHGGASGFEDVVMIDFGKIQTGYETTGLIVKTTNLAFGEVTEVGYRIAGTKSVGGNVFFVSGKAISTGSYSFLLQKVEDSYRLIKTIPNAHWGDELYTADCVK